MDTIRVTCNCEYCAEYAERTGRTFPLAADVNAKMAAGCKITERNANKASKTHGLVHAAYDTSLVMSDGTREPMSAKFGPWAV